MSQCTEIFMTYGHAFQVRFDDPPSGTKRTNVAWKESVGGIERCTKYGDRKRKRKYNLFLDATNLAIFRTAMDDLDEGARPFYIEDHEGDVWMCRLVNDPSEKYLTPGTTPITIEVIEKL